MDASIKKTVRASDKDAQYDEKAKKLLGHKIILAYILVNTIEEFREMNPKEVVNYIEGEPYISVIPVDSGMTNGKKKAGDNPGKELEDTKTTEQVSGLNTENSEINEGMIRFDIIFYVRMKDGLSQIIINVEAQTAFNPGYPLTKRAIYYCSRMISAQHGPIFTNSEYGKIRKVYSIWVCTHPTKEFQNTLIRYSIRPEQLIGNAVEKSENYDLMSVVTICLGEPGTENYTGIVKFMDVLLSSSRAATEKKKILEEEFGVAMNEELEREVLVMCNLSQGVKAEGINIGEMRMLVKQVRKGRVTIEEAAEDAGMTVEEFKKVMENTPLQAV